MANNRFLETSPIQGGAGLEHAYDDPDHGDAAKGQDQNHSQHQKSPRDVSGFPSAKVNSSSKANLAAIVPAILTTRSCASRLGLPSATQ